MGKLRDFAGAIEDAVADFGDMVRAAANELLAVPDTFYIGDAYEIGDVLVADHTSEGEHRDTFVLYKGDRVSFLSQDEHRTKLEVRHKLSSGDTQRKVIAITLTEWNLLRGRVLLTWTDQSILRKLHQRQGHG